MVELPTLYQTIIAKSRYARYLPEQNRRETWEETVERLLVYLIPKTPAISREEWIELGSAIENLEIMPSMRLLMSAGAACERDNIAAYNCSYLAINHKRSFSEILYILMNGTGVGFSCEREEIAKLPIVPEYLEYIDDVIYVGDSKRGWAVAYKKLISALYSGEIPSFNFSRVRPVGSRLHTFGGRASGPEPLARLFDFTVETFKKSIGRKLNSLEVHDIICMIGEVVVVGGVRRSALISLSNLTDRRMREAKNGQWWVDNPQRRISNNSISYTEKPDAETFVEEWLSLIKSKSGERGIFNRVAAKNQAARWGRRDNSLNYGCNPCSEIILRDKQFCNLTEVVVRENDTFETLSRKVRLATILGTIQATLTNFQFLGEEWKKNTEEERLLGVSLTGIMDNKILNDTRVQPQFGNNYLVNLLEELRSIARKTNEEYSKILGINPSAAITAVKPSGTVSQLVDSASGIHARHSSYYIRRIRMDKKDSIYQFLKDKGIPVEDDKMAASTTAVFSFPMKAPEGAICRNDMTAIEQLELWLIYQRHWCEHKPSVTISVKDEEWMEVGAWVYKHFDEVSGVSFLPHSNHTYQQAPYEDITKEQYEELLSKIPKNIDWSLFKEEEDNTEGTQTLSCTAGQCEI